MTVDQVNPRKTQVHRLMERELGMAVDMKYPAQSRKRTLLPFSVLGMSRPKHDEPNE